MQNDKNQNPEQIATEKLKSQISILNGLLNNKCDIEIEANEFVGHNTLQMITNEFGYHDAGWIENIEFDEKMRDKLLSLTMQEVIIASAMSKSCLRKTYQLDKKLKYILWILIMSLCMNFLFILNIH